MATRAVKTQLFEHLARDLSCVEIDSDDIQPRSGDDSDQEEAAYSIRRLVEGSREAASAARDRIASDAQALRAYLNSKRASASSSTNDAFADALDDATSQAK